MKLMDSERGSAAQIVLVSLLVVLLLGAVGFGVWAYMGRTDYKENVDAKIAAAVKENTQKVKAADLIAFAEESKNPLKTYTGPVEFGGVSVQYPKTWSTYAIVGASSPLSVYFQPDVVPNVASPTSSFALRIEVVQSSYSSVLRQFDSFQKQGKTKVAPYALPKVPSVVGSRLDGQVAQNKKGAMIIIPMRDKTLKIWTESETMLPDFNGIILPNASFSP
jgi:hypothetical protein